MSGRLGLLVFGLTLAFMAFVPGNTAADESPYSLVRAFAEEGPSPGQVEADYEREQAKVSAATVFPPDDRHLISDTPQPFWRTITFLLIYEEGNFDGTCSGVFLGPNVVLTAAHCIYHSGEFIDAVRAAPGASLLGPVFGLAEGFEFAVPQGWKDGGGKNVPGGLHPPSPFDWGIITFQGDPFEGRLAPYSPMAHAGNAFFEAAATSIETVGFPGDKAFGSMWAAESNEYVVDDTYLYTRIDVFSGQSGSPVFARDDNDFFVFSVVSGGNVNFNRSVRFTPAVLEALKDFCDDLGCSISTFLWQAEPPAPPQPPAPPNNVPPPPTGTLPFRVVGPFVSRD